MPHKCKAHPIPLADAKNIGFYYYSEHPMGIRTYTKRVLNFRRQAIVEQKTAGGIPSAVHLPVLRLFDRDRLFLG